jgi:putative transposase
VWAAPALFRDDVDRTTFVRELARATRRFEWTCIGFCLMTTHHHLLLAVQEGALPKGMQSLNFRYAITFNQRYRLRGHVQYRRYGARRITTDGDLLGAYKYMARNPVEAGLCSSPTEWPWSSVAGTVGAAEPHSFVDPNHVLSCFDCPREIAAARLRAAVDVP